MSKKTKEAIKAWSLALGVLLGLVTLWLACVIQTLPVDISKFDDTTTAGEIWTVACLQHPRWEIVHRSFLFASMICLTLRFCISNFNIWYPPKED